MPNWVNKMLEHNPGEKSLKAPYAFYIDLEYIFKKLESSQNNPEKNLIIIQEKIALKTYVKN